MSANHTVSHTPLVLKERLPRLSRGDPFGDYVVVDALFTGLTLEYYRIYDPDSDALFVITILHPLSVEDFGLRRKINDLMIALSQLGDSSIATIHSYVEIDGYPCILWDAIKAEPLSSSILAKDSSIVGGFDPEQASAVILHIIKIVKLAQALKIDHRRLSSSLIFEREDYSLCIFGFGVRSIISDRVLKSIKNASKNRAPSTEPKDKRSKNAQMAYVDNDSYPEVDGIFQLAYELLMGRKPQGGDFSPALGINGLNESWRNFFQLAQGRKRNYDLNKIVALFAPEKPGNNGLVKKALFRSGRSLLRFVPVPKHAKIKGRRSSEFYQKVIGFICSIWLASLVIESGLPTYIKNLFAPPPIAQPVETDWNVHINVVPENTNLKFVFTGEDFQAIDSAFKFKVLPGVWDIVLTSPGKLSQAMTISTIGTKPVEQIIELYELADTIYLDTNVPNAHLVSHSQSDTPKVFATSDEVGRILLRKQWFEENETLLLQSDGYYSKELPLSAVPFGKQEHTRLNLAIIPALLELSTAQEGVGVYLNDNYVGDSPIELNNITPRIPHEITLKKPGYESIKQSLTLQPGELRQLRLGELRKLNSGTLTLNINLPKTSPGAASELRYEDLLIEINGSRTPYGIYTFENTRAGSHKITVKHPLLKTIDQTVQLEDKRTLEVSLNLEWKPSYIGIEIPAQYDADVYLNSRYRGANERTFEVSNNESHTVEISIANHYTMKRSFEVGPGKQVIWQVKPIPLPKPEIGKDYSVPYIGLDLKWLNPGKAYFGSPKKEPHRLANESEQASFEMTDGFWMGATEVTQRVFSLVMNKRKSRGNTTLPVNEVTWKEAIEFCEHLNKREAAAGRLPEGYRYRLPSEAEWEYAARAGTRTPYYYGTKADSNMGNFRDSGRSAAGMAYATDEDLMPVASYEPNPFGLYDMFGNVSELTSDIYQYRMDPYGSPPSSQILSYTKIAVRGGSWETLAKNARSAARYQVSVSTSRKSLGFRVVLAPY